MDLGSLFELVETLRKRIEEHHPALSGNEMLTRYALIDPLLRELGWDTSDPATTIPEDTSGLGRGRPDYVLIADAQPTMVVEAKKLGAGLQDGANQAIQYAMDPNRQARYFAITDGQNWEIFDTQKPAYDMSVISFDLSAASPAEVCLKALALWRRSVAAGSVSAAQAPIIEPQLEAQPAEQPEPTQVYSQVAVNQPAPRISERQSASEFLDTLRALRAQQEQAKDVQAISVSKNANEADDVGWTSLSDVIVKKGGSPPVEIEFPDGKRVQAGRWTHVMREFIRWLIDNNHINQSHCPIRYASKYIMADSPIHPNGNGFRYIAKIEEFYIEMNVGPSACVRNSIMVIQRTGQDPSQFKIRFDEYSASSHVSATVSAIVDRTSYGNADWIPLSELSVIGRSSPPTEIQFPDNSLSQIRRWNIVVTESVRWLQANGYLNSSNWRIRRNSRYVVSDSPIHPNGKEFTAPRSVDHLYVEGNYNAVNHIENAIIIIERTGQDPAQFKVRFAS